VLLAFLALYVGWAGTHLWGILCFCLHQLRSTTGDHDGLHYQQLAIFRNSSSASAALWRLLQLGWYWRHSTNGAIRRTLLLLLIIVVHVISFIAAATLSSRVTSPGADEALVKSNLCGWPDYSIISDFGDWTPEEVKIANATFTAAHEIYRGAAAYVRSCYGDEDMSSYSSICSRYVKRRIVSNVNKTAPCPFADGACMTPAISMDSGHLDSDLHLGITAKPTNRVQMRRLTTCAPIPAEQKYSVGKITEIKPLKGPAGEPQSIYYYLGPILGEETKFTYTVNNYSLIYASEPYTLRSVSFNFSAAG